MPKYRICPICNAKNAANVTCCTSCGYMRLSKEKIHEEAIIEEKYVKICICGEHNPPNARKCVSCGEDISTFTVVKACSDSKEKAINGFALESIDGDYRFILPEGNTRIGRDAGMKEYLVEKLYIGRSHAEFIKTENRLFIKDLHSKNHVFVNNVEIPLDEPFELHVGDEIGIGGKKVGGNRQSKAAYFTVKACD